MVNTGRGRNQRLVCLVFGTAGAEGAERKRHSLVARTCFCIAAVAEIVAAALGSLQAVRQTDSETHLAAARRGRRVSCHGGAGGALSGLAMWTCALESARAG